MPISPKDYWMGRDASHASELTEEIRQAAAVTVERVNALLEIAKRPNARVRSGWRPAEINASIPGAALHSKHMTGEACDIADPGGELGRWVLDNEQALVDVGLWCEAPSHTPTWVHFQTKPPKSGKRFFIP